MPDSDVESARDLLALRLDLFLERTITVGLESDQLLQAYDLVEIAHVNQLTREGRPYSSQLIDTALAVKANGGDIQSIVSAMTLDVVEDSAFSEEEFASAVPEQGEALCKRVSAPLARLAIHDRFGDEHPIVRGAREHFVSILV